MAAVASCPFAGSAANGHGPMPRYLVERLLLDTTGYLEDVILPHDAPDCARSDRRGPRAAGHRRLPGAGRRGRGALRLGRTRCSRA